MALNPNDELNVLNREEDYKRRAVPFPEFYRPMGIGREQKERRIKAAERLSDVFAAALWLARPDNEMAVANVGMMLMYLQSELMKAYADITDRYEMQWYREHASDVINEVTDATQRHIDDPYFTSDDRADLIAENEANSLIGYDELQNAIDAGFTLKTWNGMLDKRERDSHIAMEGTTIPIEQPFDVNGSFLMMPGDWQFNPDPAEVVNCRCWLTFS